MKSVKKYNGGDMLYLVTRYKKKGWFDFCLHQTTVTKDKVRGMEDKGEKNEFTISIFHCL